MPFEVFLEQGDQQRGLPRWRWLAGLMTIPLHVGALLAVAIHSFWEVGEVSPPGIGVTFLPGAPPPVPLPPPRWKKATATQHGQPPGHMARVKADQPIQPREEQPPRDPRAVAAVG